MSMRQWMSLRCMDGACFCTALSRCSPRSAFITSVAAAAATAYLPWNRSPCMARCGTLRYPLNPRAAASLVLERPKAPHLLPWENPCTTAEADAPGYAAQLPESCLQGAAHLIEILRSRRSPTTALAGARELECVISPSTSASRPTTPGNAPRRSPPERVSEVDYSEHRHALADTWRAVPASSSPPDLAGAIEANCRRRRAARQARARSWSIPPRQSAVRRLAPSR